MVKRIKGSNRNSLGIDSVRLTASKMITLIISMIISMLLSRFRTLEEYGTYSQILLVINLITSLFLLGLPNSINFFLARSETLQDQQKFLSVYYTLSTIISIIIGAVLVCAVPLIESFFDNHSIGKYYYFLALFPWSQIISNSIEHVLVVYKHTKDLVTYRVLHSAIMLFLVLIVQWVNWGFREYMFLYCAANSIFALIVYLMSYRISGGLTASFDVTLIKQIFTFSIPIGLASLVGTINIQIDKLMIGYLMDTEQFQIYTNSAKELPVAFIASSITAVMLPQITRMVKNNKGKDAIKLWGTASELSMIVIALIVAGVFVFAKETMIILYSDKYLPGLNVFRIYTLGILLRSTYYGMMLNAYGKTKYIFYCSIGSMLLNCILNPIFYSLFGMVGPAIATLIAQFFIQILQLFMTRKLVGVSFMYVHPWKNLSYILIINILFSLLFTLLKRTIHLDAQIGSIPSALIFGFFWCFLYAIVMKNKIRNTWNRLNVENEL